MTEINADFDPLRNCVWMRSYGHVVDALAATNVDVPEIPILQFEAIAKVLEDYHHYAACFRQAHGCVVELPRLKELGVAEDVQDALRGLAVIRYMVPFGKNRNDGETRKRTALHPHAILSGKDAIALRDMHNKIKKLRNKSVAHSDPDEAHCRAGIVVFQRPPDTALYTEGFALNEQTLVPASFDGAMFATLALRMLEHCQGQAQRYAHELGDYFSKHHAEIRPHLKAYRVNTGTGAQAGICMGAPA